MKVTLTYVKNDPKVSKAGKPWTSCSIKTKEHGDLWLNGFGNKETKLWNVGDTIEVEVYEEDYNGKTYKKFKTISPEDRIDGLTKQLKQACDVIRGLDKRVKALEALEAKTVVKNSPVERFEEEVINERHDKYEVGGSDEFPLI